MITNYEKFKEVIEEIWKHSGLAVVNGKPASCKCTSCLNCDMHDDEYEKDCDPLIQKWLVSEYEVDWSKVAVDTPILVRDNEDDEWTRRYFAKFENGLVRTWDKGATAWSSKGYTTCWRYAILAESEE